MAPHRVSRPPRGDRRRIPEEGLEGRLRTRKWQDKEGQDRYTTEIVADSMQMLGSRAGSGEPRAEPMARAGEPKPAAAAGATAKKPAGKFDDMEDDIPF